MAKELNFEQALTRLGEVVAELEAGKVGLDESLKLYEEGMKLVRLCNEKLDSAEQRVLTVRPAGEDVEVKPFGEEQA